MSTQLQTDAKMAKVPSWAPVQTGFLQRQCACGQHTTAGSECAECHQKREGTLQRAAVSTAPANGVPPIVHDVLNSSGRPLDAGTRAFMEPRFGHDFSGVRVHTDARAAESARAVNALAYTVGRDVVFGEGQYEPETSEGKRLMAHELTHVVQQGGTIQAKSRSLELDSVDTPYEMEAKRIAKTIDRGETLETANRNAISAIQTAYSALTMQRFVEPEHAMLGDTSIASLSKIMNFLASAEKFLQNEQSAISILGQIKKLWEQHKGDPEVLRLLNESIKANNRGDYKTALNRLEEATPLIATWVQLHPKAGGGLITTIAGREHPEIKELIAADTALPPLTLEGSGVLATYGEILSLGDIYPFTEGKIDPATEAMHKAPRQELTNPQGQGILDITRAQVSRRAEKATNFDLAYQQATQWRERVLYDKQKQPLLDKAGKEVREGKKAGVGEKSYGTLAKENKEHFAGANKTTWEKYHTKALELAAKASTEKNPLKRVRLINQAYTLNAFGDHFLTDAFAAGHLIHKEKVKEGVAKLWHEHKTEALDNFTTALLNDHLGDVIKMVGRKLPLYPLNLVLVGPVTLLLLPLVRNQIKDKICDLEREDPQVIVNAAVKVVHDYYNKQGIEVHNEKKDHWRTFGDEHLNKSATTWQLAALAVLRSRVDVTQTIGGKPTSHPFAAWDYTPIIPTNIDNIALKVLQDLIMRPHNNKLADLFVKQIATVEYIEKFKEEEEKRAVEVVPRWDQLPPDAQRDLASRDYDESWFKEQSPEIRLTVLNLYVKLSGLKLWEFVDTQSNTKVGAIDFLCSRIDAFKETLSNRPDFTSPEKSADEWSSREMRASGQLHFKHFKGWPETQVEAHIDKVGLLLRSKWWWLFPPIPLIQMARHGLDYSGYQDVYGIRKLLLDQGWYPAPLIGVPQAAKREQSKKKGCNP
jgi:hypothetical protein